MVRVHAADGADAGLPGLAPVALQQGRYAARAVRDRLAGRRSAPFRYADKGNLATIGRSRAVADVKGIHVAGFPAWVLWLLVHLFYLTGFQNRLLVVLRWTISFVTRGRGARLIVLPALGTDARPYTEIAEARAGGDAPEHGGMGGARRQRAADRFEAAERRGRPGARLHGQLARFEKMSVGPAVAIGCATPKNGTNVEADVVRPS